MIIRYLKHTQDARPNDIRDVTPERGRQLVEAGIATTAPKPEMRETKPAAPVETKRKRKAKVVDHDE